MSVRLLVLALWINLSSIATSADRPNVLMIVADQLRYESCGYAGDEKAITPTIDRLASERNEFR